MATFNITKTQLGCPDCEAWLDLTITLGPGRLSDGAWVVDVGFDGERFISDMTAHVAAAPESHPTFVEGWDEPARRWVHDDD